MLAYQIIFFLYIFFPQHNLKHHLKTKFHYIILPLNSSYLDQPPKVMNKHIQFLFPFHHNHIHPLIHILFIFLLQFLKFFFFFLELVSLVILIQKVELFSQLFLYNLEKFHHLSTILHNLLSFKLFQIIRFFLNKKQVKLILKCSNLSIFHLDYISTNFVNFPK